MTRNIKTKKMKWVLIIGLVIFLLISPIISLAALSERQQKVLKQYGSETQEYKDAIKQAKKENPKYNMPDTKIPSTIIQTYILQSQDEIPPANGPETFAYSTFSGLSAAETRSYTKKELREKYEIDERTAREQTARWQYATEHADTMPGKNDGEPLEQYDKFDTLMVKPATAIPDPMIAVGLKRDPKLVYELAGKVEVRSPVDPWGRPLCVAGTTRFQKTCLMDVPLGQKINAYQQVTDKAINDDDPETLAKVYDFLHNPDSKASTLMSDFERRRQLARVAQEIKDRQIKIDAEGNIARNKKGKVVIEEIPPVSKPESQKPEKQEAKKEEKIDEPQQEQYIIKKGDTLAEIAKQTGTTVEELQKANPQILDPSKIKVDQRIALRDKYQKIEIDKKPTLLCANAGLYNLPLANLV